MLAALKNAASKSMSTFKEAVPGLGGAKGVVTLGVHRGSIRQIAFSPDGKHAATASGDNTVVVWDLDNASAGVTLGSVPDNLTGGGVGTGHKHIVTSVCFSPDGRFVASGSYDKTLRVWSMPNGTMLAVMTGHMQIVSSVAFHPSSSAVMTGSVDSTVRLWRLSQDGNEDWSIFPWGNGVILEFAFAHTQASFLSDDHEDSEEFYRRTNRQRRHIPEMKCDLCTLSTSSPVVSAVFSTTGDRVVAGSTDGAIRVWDYARISASTIPQALLLHIPGPGPRAESICLIAGVGQGPGRIAMGFTNASLLVYDLSTGALVQRFEKFKGYPIALSSCPGSRDVVLACCGSSRLLVLHVPSGRQVTQ
jgi:WD40 repeat protein